MNCSNEDEGSSEMNNDSIAGLKVISIPMIYLHQEFHSFIELRAAIDKYQKERSVQLIVKDSKLLEAESTRKVIPKVYHLVNKDLMYHSITYCCKCHGQLKKKQNSRIRNAGAKRLNCPMYFRLRLSSDFQKLVIFDMKEEHNHAIDPNTCQLTPRQQVYTFSRLKKDMESKSDLQKGNAPHASPVKVSIGAAAFEPEYKRLKLNDENESDQPSQKSTNTNRHLYDPHLNLPTENSDSPLDSESSSSDDSDIDDFDQIHRNILPFPIRLIGSAIQSSPDLIEASKSLIEMQKSNLSLAKKKLLLKTKKLELENAKLELELKRMQKNDNEMSAFDNNQDTTIYLHTS